MSKLNINACVLIISIVSFSISIYNTYVINSIGDSINHIKIDTKDGFDRITKNGRMSRNHSGRYNIGSYILDTNKKVEEIYGNIFSNNRSSDSNSDYLIDCNNEENKSTGSCKLRDYLKSTDKKH